MRKAGALGLGLVLAVVVSCPRVVRAMGAVVGPQEAPATMARLRTAVAVGDGRTTRWAQVTPVASESGLAWLVPLNPGARVDMASDAWLDALDASTVPVVLPPATPPSCVVPLSPDVAAPGTSPSSRSPRSWQLASSFATLSSFVSGAGLSIPAGLASEIATSFSSGQSVLALVYGPGSLPLRSLRIVDAGPADLPFTLSAQVGAPIDATVFTIGPSEERPSSAPLSVDPAKVQWLRDGESTYPSALSSLLAAWGGSRWVVQSAGVGGLFDAASVASGVTLPSVLEGYFTLAQKYGDTASDPSACTAAAGATATADASYQAACPSGSIATVPGPSPCSASTPSGAPVSPLACGTAIDGALAVATLSPSAIWVTRMAGLVTDSSAVDVALVDGGQAPQSPALAAQGYLGTCGGDDPDGGLFVDDMDAGWDDGGVDDAGYALEGDGGAGGGDGLGLGDGGLGAVEGAGVDEGTTTDTEDTSSSESAADAVDGCSGSSSTAEEDNSGGCGGDTSSTSSSSDSESNGCSGDTSSYTSDCSLASGAHTHGRRTRSPFPQGAIGLAVLLAGVRRMRRPSRSSSS
jgi:hypothetical protein